MHLTTLLTGLVSLLSIATAIPMASETPTSTTSVGKSLISPSSSASASPTPSPNPYEAYTCPPGKFKSCCMSVQQTGKDIVKSLGELVPVLGGVQVSSAIAFQCKNMTEIEAPDTCTGKGYNPMCCNTQNDGTSFNTCKPFEDVKRAYYSNQMKDVPESQADMIMDILT
ncbi:hypothetical protein DTO013E5_6030 [Penicillium roqueforti]|uniref:Genomic scaffold, ProqFM164S01 n=1 Tax=Penicillium roqueforti (strain FM164) TaxID=1365484 RepID=W6Q5W6_PENRF|nr:uncharacterized protein LCP9604111_6418 [Penicillium roqueforti]CDM29639.1 unnamed protein product [Penicillium roqueforti FM164]KAF9246658.1 hypothetical protein LCP9604111_6418 [Penicillium roqueforti]KAI1832523.1 hypothetical protein CBS147337_6781 [Penicillium roqueforti]KAI2676205.1 hypothetical protein LCP963914a_8450 [Penicillium roqueforti]KAI2683315.1 hypothetical protein CBS147355_2455 [Penicillium roqueforti]